MCVCTGRTKRLACVHMRDRRIYVCVHKKDGRTHVCVHRKDGKTHMCVLHRKERRTRLCAKRDNLPPANEGKNPHALLPAAPALSAPPKSKPIPKIDCFVRKRSPSLDNVPFLCPFY